MCPDPVPPACVLARTACNEGRVKCKTATGSTSVISGADNQAQFKATYKTPASSETHYACVLPKSEVVDMETEAAHAFKPWRGIYCNTWRGQNLPDAPQECMCVEMPQMPRKAIKCPKAPSECVCGCSTSIWPMQLSLAKASYQTLKTATWIFMLDRIALTSVFVFTI